MLIKRTVVRAYAGVSHITFLLSERSLQSSWSHPDVPFLIFAQNSLNAPAVTYHGGPTGSGIGVQLIFWGDWWNSPEGISRQVTIQARMQAALASPYFSELSQYGIESPHWRGGTIVTDPGPTMAFNSNDDQQSAWDMIDDLIDDDVFPDPDDEQIAFLIFMPNGFTQSVGANGAHSSDFNYTFPIDEDYFWAAWIRSFDQPNDNPEDVIRTATHELVELISDPQQNAWYAGNPQSGEIGDAALDNDGTTKQSAWVNGAKVQAYWSNRHGATIIPIDRDYKARIVGNIKQTHRTDESGTFRSDPSDSRLCDLLPACCMKDRAYGLTLTKYDEKAKLRVETERYRQPIITWSVAGVPIASDVTLPINVLGGTFAGHQITYQSMIVPLQCHLDGNQLELSTSSSGANFDVTVSCTVRDGSIEGVLKTDVVATPSVELGFVGVELDIDSEYTKQREACEKAAEKMFKDLGKNIPQGVHRPGNPVELESGILADMPAHARVRQFARAKRVVDLAQQAQALLPPDEARLLVTSLITDVPALRGALVNRAAAQGRPG